MAEKDIKKPARKKRPLSKQGTLPVPATVEQVPDWLRLLLGKYGEAQGILVGLHDDTPPLPGLATAGMAGVGRPPAPDDSPEELSSLLEQMAEEGPPDVDAARSATSVEWGDPPPDESTEDTPSIDAVLSGIGPPSDEVAYGEEEELPPAPDWLNDISQTDKPFTPEPEVEEQPIQIPENEIPDWLNEAAPETTGTDINAEVPIATDDVPDWLTEELTAPTATETPTPPQFTDSAEDQFDVPGWLTDPITSPDVPPSDEGISSLQASASDDTGEDTFDVPDWLTGMVPAALVSDDDEPMMAVEDTTAQPDEITDWDVPDWISDGLEQPSASEADTPSPFTDVTAQSEAVDSSVVPQPSTIDEEIPSGQDSEPGSSSPDWLASIGSLPAAIPDEEDFSFSESSAEVPSKDDWLAGLREELPADEADTLDTDTAQAKPTEAETEIPEWLTSEPEINEIPSIGANSPEPSDIDELQPGEPAHVEEIPDWLKADAEELEVPVPPPSVAESATIDDELEIPDWLSDTSDDSQTTEITEDDQSSIPDVLTGAALAGAGLAAAAALTDQPDAEEPQDTDQDWLSSLRSPDAEPTEPSDEAPPDWLADLSTDADAATDTDAATADDDTPDWLTGLSDDDDSDAPDWLTAVDDDQPDAPSDDDPASTAIAGAALAGAGLAAAAALTDQPDAEAPQDTDQDWLSSLRSPDAEPTEPSDEAPPDWLADLSTDADAAADADTADADTPDWLTGLSDADDDTDAPDWLTAVDDQPDAPSDDDPASTAIAGAALAGAGLAAAALTDQPDAEAPQDTDQDWLSSLRSPDAEPTEPSDEAPPDWLADLSTDADDAATADWLTDAATADDDTDAPTGSPLLMMTSPTLPRTTTQLPPRLPEPLSPGPAWLPPPSPTSRTPKRRRIPTRTGSLLFALRTPNQPNLLMKHRLTGWLTSPPMPTPIPMPLPMMTHLTGSPACLMMMTPMPRIGSPLLMMTSPTLPRTTTQLPPRLPEPLSPGPALLLPPPSPTSRTPKNRRIPTRTGSLLFALRTPNQPNLLMKHRLTGWLTSPPMPTPIPMLTPPMMTHLTGSPACLMMMTPMPRIGSPLLMMTSPTLPRTTTQLPPRLPEPLSPGPAWLLPPPSPTSRTPKNRRIPTRTGSLLFALRTPNQPNLLMKHRLTGWLTSPPMPTPIPMLTPPMMTHLTGSPACLMMMTPMPRIGSPLLMMTSPTLPRTTTQLPPRLPEPLSPGPALLLPPPSPTSRTSKNRRIPTRTGSLLFAPRTPNQPNLLMKHRLTGWLTSPPMPLPPMMTHLTGSPACLMLMMIPMPRIGSPLLMMTSPTLPRTTTQLPPRLPEPLSPGPALLLPPPSPTSRTPKNRRIPTRTGSPACLMMMTPMPRIGSPLLMMTSPTLPRTTTQLPPRLPEPLSPGPALLLPPPSPTSRTPKRRRIPTRTGSLLFAPRKEMEVLNLPIG
jgi:hypothetical protein